MANEYLTKENISTIATWTAILITMILSYFGITYDYNALIPVTSGIITLIIAIWSSKNPNNLAILGNQPNKINTNETVLNPEYECEQQ